MGFFLQYIRSFGDNFGTVVPSLIYRSAEPSKEKLSRYQTQLELSAVLNLRIEAGDEERAEVESLGLSYWHIPMRDDTAPTDEQVKAALDYLRLGRRTLICCTGGRHRTSLISACYLVAVKLSTKAAAWKLNDKFGWYDAQGHKPLRLWFEREFDPSRFR